MAHYAKVESGLVTQVIVAEPEFFDTFVDPSPGEWIQTSYNTQGGIHSEGGVALRENYAGVGYTYDKIRDAFIPPSPPEYDANQYQRYRKAEYDALNQLELISDDASNGTTTWLDAIAAIKTKYPKPQRAI